MKNATGKAVSNIFDIGPPAITVLGSDIPYERKAVKNLGLLLDPTLSWSEHGKQVCRKTLYSLHCLQRLKYIMPQSVKLTLVQALIFPIFDYTDVVYLSLREQDAKRLQCAQNSCMRFIFNVKRRDHITPTYMEANCLKLKYRRAMHAVTLIFKILKSRSPAYLHCRLRPLTSVRNGLLLRAPERKTAAYGKMYVPYACRLWNTLPKEVRSEATIASFKSKLLKFMLDKQAIDAPI